MEVPKFLLADNTSNPEDVYVIHTEYPRFILSLNTETVEWWDSIEREEDLLLNATELIHEAYKFYEKEMETYENENHN